MLGQLVNKVLEGVGDIADISFEKLLINLKKHESILAIKEMVSLRNVSRKSDGGIESDRTWNKPKRNDNNQKRCAYRHQMGHSRVNCPTLNQRRQLVVNQVD